jgi:hypothetical protein
MLERNLFFPALFLSVLVMWGCTHAQRATSPASAQKTPTPPAREVRVTTGPVVRSVTETSAVIAWSTNVITDTLLRYGKRSDNLDQVARSPWDGLSHSVQLGNLTPGTTYYYRVGTSKPQSTEPMNSAANFRTQAAQSRP